MKASEWFEILGEAPFWCPEGVACVVSIPDDLDFLTLTDLLEYVAEGPPARLADRVDPTSFAWRGRAMTCAHCGRSHEDSLWGYFACWEKSVVSQLDDLEEEIFREADAIDRTEWFSGNLKIEEIRRLLQERNS